MTDAPTKKPPTLDELLAAARREPGNVLREAMGVAATMRDERVAEGDALLAALYNTFAAVCAFVRDERKAQGVEVDTTIAESLGIQVGEVTVEPDTTDSAPNDSEGE